MSEATKNLELLKAAAVDPRVKMTAQMAIDAIEQMADELQGERWDNDLKDKEIERLREALDQFKGLPPGEYVHTGDMTSSIVITKEALGDE